MGRRKAVGAAIFALSMAGFVAYAYLLMLSEWSPIVLQLSVMMIVGGILGVISWIGYTMATTRPSSSLVYFDPAAAFSPPQGPGGPRAGSGPAGAQVPAEGPPRRPADNSGDSSGARPPAEGDP